MVDLPAIAATVEALAVELRRTPGAIVTVPPDQPPPRRAAVAVVLTPVGRARLGRAPVGLAALFVRRAEYPGDPWSGHIAFPGGRTEPGDLTPWDTAVRETWEETGLDLRAAARLLGTLDELHPRPPTPTLPPIIVRPHVVVIDTPPPLQLSAELVDAFWAPLDTLRTPDVDRPSTVLARGMPLVVPSFVYAGHTIWGMTERILRQLFERLDPVASTVRTASSDRTGQSGEHRSPIV